ncbi:hypothetical protein BDM02DRAFT_1923500 [Thelephora ganbajun]|uniref:Uncharacterized protein n=1 Tax=Thelephora ganbajun TaxID=370292 RepID=A0ACB6ZUE9_THEGA|nr:hypothetical protein BDM02DRAFT_1923500 [Thelephora ganbajun]
MTSIAWTWRRMDHAAPPLHASRIGVAWIHLQFSWSASWSPSRQFVYIPLLYSPTARTQVSLCISLSPSLRPKCHSSRADLFCGIS